MKLTDEQLRKLMEQNNIHNHEHKHNNKTCEKKCDRKKIKILLEIQAVQKQITEKMLDRKTGNKKIKEIKRYWNEEHPEHQIYESSIIKKTRK